MLIQGSMEVAGGGGYPAAGIGGGGAGGGGGTCCAGGGGFSGGSTEEGTTKGDYTNCTDNTKGTNGMAGKYDSDSIGYMDLVGGGYYQGPSIRNYNGKKPSASNSTYKTITGTFTGDFYRCTIVDSSNRPQSGKNVNPELQMLGGSYGYGWQGNCYASSKIYFLFGTHQSTNANGVVSYHTGTHIGGSGGKAGNGGNVKISTAANVFAYNGKISSSSSESSIIYLQGGVQNTRYFADHFCRNGSYEFKIIDSGKANAPVLSYTNSKASGSRILNISVDNVMSTKSFNYNKQGIGSGAGYIEESNGTFSIVN